MNKQQLIDKIRQFLELQPGWDSYGALAIDPAIIEAAVKLVEAVDVWGPPWPTVVPCSGGQLQFEWDGQEQGLELELETAATIHYLKWDPPIEEEEIFSIDDTKRVVELIEWYFGTLKGD